MAAFVSRGGVEEGFEEGVKDGGERGGEDILARFELEELVVEVLLGEAAIDGWGECRTEVRDEGY